MENPDLLPFKVGQVAEAKSFSKGYRGAWFRCKIHEIVVKSGQIWHALEYIDFPDEKRKRLKIYQVSVWIKVKGKEKERQLMVRPQYPYWLTDGCFWTGRLTQVFNDGNAEVTLILPPVGEGGVYEVSCKDLRPSLDWSPEYGWRAPSLQEDESCYNYARLMQQLEQGINNTGAPAAGHMKCDIDYKDEGSKDVDDKTVSPIHASISSHNSANSLRASRKSDSSKIRDITGVSGSIVPKTRRLEDLDMRDSGIEKPSLSDSVSSSHIKCASTETAVHTGPEDLDNSEGAKKVKTGGSPPLNIMVSDSLDAVLMDLEELANKIQWLKGILDFGIPLQNGTTPSWKLVEHRGSSTPK
ncbi:Agenet domain-containing protein [Heracleum sosnowskyi]|uniref:Agenet domain-containing protein n=1 Tax=Heracleum sosnowskyi TaxID=360622 RepID=A0AAD8MKU4_9APIA|nr:Agenet domain-containing protein [Heracleum sosnowskyi]